MIIRLRKSVLLTFDLLSLFCAMFIAFRCTLSPHIFGMTPDIMKLIFLLSGSALFCVLYFTHKGHYGVKIPWWQQVRHVLRAVIWMMIGDVLLNYAVIPDVAGQAGILLTWIMAIAILLVMRWVSRFVLKKLGRWDVSAIVIGGAQNVSETLYALKSELYLSYKIRKVVLLHAKDDDIADVAAHHPDVQLDTRFDTIYPNELVVMCPDDFDPFFQREVMDKVKAAGGRYAISPPTNGLSFYGLRPQYYFGYRIVLLEASIRPQTFLAWFTKEILDRCGACVGLLALSPVFLFLIYKIRQDGGPAFYSQQRVGHNGKEFKCWKFRSMIPNAEAVLSEYLEQNPEARTEYARDFKLKNDPRITRIGHVLRQSSLDEIPQLYNVLIGNMSLVGPRPIVQAETAYYQDHLKYYLSVKPGMTGIWQVSGRNDISYAQRVSLDTWYVENWSLWNDIVIIFKTIYVVFLRKGAY